MSLEEQAHHGSSLLNQKNRAKEYAKYKGLVIYCFYIDAGISGSNMEKRPALNKMLAELKRGTNVIVTTISRLARNACDASLIEREISSKGGTITSISENFSTGESSGKFLFQMLSTFGELERNQTSERVSSVLNGLSSKGRLRGKPPYGYKYVGAKEPWVKVEEEQAVIQKLRDFKIKTPSATVAQLTKMINSDSSARSRTGKPFHHGTIKTILEQNGIMKHTSYTEEASP